MHRFILALFSLLLLFGCNDTKIKSTTDTITVSILPQKYILEQIAGDRYHINVLVPDGSGPETYEPTAMQMLEMSRSKACIITGLLDFEKSWLTKISEQYPELQVVNTSTRVDLIEGHEGEEGDAGDEATAGHAGDVGHEEHDGDHNHAEAGHHHHAGGIDPHIWLSIRAVKAQSDMILDYLVKSDPENGQMYTDNHSKFIVRMDSLDKIIADKFNALEKPVSFMIYHPSLGYYARDYDLLQIPIELEGKEPSPAYMMDLIDQAKDVNITTIFYSEQFDKRSAETLARQLNVKLTAFNPLAENIEKNLLSITENIVNSTVK